MQKEKEIELHSSQASKHQPNRNYNTRRPNQHVWSGSVQAHWPRCFMWLCVLQHANKIRTDFIVSASGLVLGSGFALRFWPMAHVWYWLCCIKEKWSKGFRWSQQGPRQGLVSWNGATCLTAIQFEQVSAWNWHGLDWPRPPEHALPATCNAPGMCQNVTKAVIVWVKTKSGVSSLCNNFKRKYTFYLESDLVWKVATARQDSLRSWSSHPSSWLRHQKRVSKGFGGQCFFKHGNRASRRRHWASKKRHSSSLTLDRAICRWKGAHWIKVCTHNTIT